ncbi:hypothetical protein ABTX79_15155, partial [Streptomyces sp. NPDC096153]
MSRRALARTLALGVVQRLCTVAAPTAAARADEIPDSPDTGWSAPPRGAPATAGSVPGTPPPQHPYRAPNGRSGMLADAAGSGTTRARSAT